MTSCESKWFEWRGWDSIDEGIAVYYDVKLKQEIGEFAEGTVFTAALVDLQTSKLTLQEGSHADTVLREHSYRLSLVVGEKLPAENDCEDLGESGES